jgi:hypothetical protein
MGSNKSKPRKRKKGAHQPQHLPKVGSAPENERLLHDEQQAVLSQMGFGHASSGTKTVVGVVLALCAVGAVLGLIMLTVALVR